MKKGISWKTTMFEMLCSNCRVKRRWGRVQARTATTSWAKATTPTAPITIVPLHPAVASTTATIQGTPQPRQRSTVATATAINNTQNININFSSFWSKLATSSLSRSIFFPSKYVSECSSETISGHVLCLLWTKSTSSFYGQEYVLRSCESLFPSCFGCFCHELTFHTECSSASSWTRPLVP